MTPRKYIYKRTDCYTYEFTRQGPATERGSIHRIPSLTKKLPENDTY